LHIASAVGTVTFSLLFWCRQNINTTVMTGEVNKARQLHGTVSQGSGGPWCLITFALRIHVHNPVERQTLELSCPYAWTNQWAADNLLAAEQ
jgi:hypothetical protein